jgi:hypothetical protein
MVHVNAITHARSESRPAGLHRAPKASATLARRAIDAVRGALEPFEGMVDELLATAPEDALHG